MSSTSAATSSVVLNARNTAVDVVGSSLEGLMSQFNSGVDSVLQGQRDLRARLESLSAGACVCASSDASAFHV